MECDHEREINKKMKIHIKQHLTLFNVLKQCNNNLILIEQAGNDLLETHDNVCRK